MPHRHVEERGRQVVRLSPECIIERYIFHLPQEKDPRVLPDERTGYNLLRVTPLVLPEI